MHPDTHLIWSTWNHESTAITANDSLCLSQWQQTASAAVTTDYDWRNWVTAQVPTAEQRVEERRQQAILAERRRSIETVRKAAAERAEHLLEACLSTAQRDQFRQQGAFEVRGASGRRYLVQRGRVRNVVDIKTRRLYCCHPVDNVPDADTMLAQKLMIETQEDEFLRLANVS